MKKILYTCLVFFIFNMYGASRGEQRLNIVIENRTEAPLMVSFTMGHKGGNERTIPQKVIVSAGGKKEVSFGENYKNGLTMNFYNQKFRKDKDNYINAAGYSKIEITLLPGSKYEWREII